MKLVNVPGINGLGKTFGCDNAFDEVVKHLKNLELNERGVSLEDVNVLEIGVDYDSIEVNNELIYERAFSLFGEKVMFVGGDHSISYPLTRAFFDKCESIGREPCLIVMDAHPDCMEPMKEPTHEEWLRKLIEDGFPAQNILLIGVRNISPEELSFLREKKIKSISLNSFLVNIEDSCDSLMEFARGKELYVSIDIDVVDPSFAPGTGYREVGGFTSREVIYLIQRISKMKNLRAVDLVEINPEKDFEDLTVKLGAKIVSEVISD
ncbi:MAG: arginase family protein [Candidatus Pacearchaeota archaeon]|nr:arginase family protein [Candidatus Pacearchaeota archaeon]